MLENLKELIGISPQELQERVVQKIASDVLLHSAFDDDEGEFKTDSKFGRDLQKLVKERIDKRVNEIAEKFVLPNVSEYIENLVLQQTNEWGEKKGEPVTFTEYLVLRANNYIVEKVNYEGKDQKEVNGYSWSGTQTRLTYLVHKHLHYTIEGAMKDAVKTVSDSIVPALTETCKIKLTEIASGLKLTVATK